MKKSVFLAFVLVLLSTAVVVGLIRPVEAQGTIYISADGSVVGTDKIQRDGNVYTFTDNINASIVVERSNITIDGNGYTLQGMGGGVGIDLHKIRNVTIKDMDIRAFSYGIILGPYGYPTVSSNNIISGNNITNCGNGIKLSQSANNSIYGNNIENNHEGIVLELSSNNSIYRNYIANNGDGVEQSYSNYNSILENDVLDNKGDGIHLQWSLKNSIHGNHVANNTHSNIVLTDSSNNTISGNNVTNSPMGIGLYGLFYNSSNNNVYGNNLVQNGYGIFLSEFGDIKGNSFYHNNLVNNTQQINIETRDFTNFWDNGFEGNYWSDYNGTDSDNDGIGDNPYVIDENNQDNYPLMGMFYDFTVEIGYQQFSHMHVISNSTVSNLEGVYHWLTSPNEYFQAGQPFIPFYFSGEEGSVGFCRIMIPRAVLNDSYVVLLVEVPYLEFVEVPFIELPISNSTHAYLYFTYDHSTQEVIITIPEFPTWISMLLILIVLTVAITIYKRRPLKTPIH